VPNCNGSRLAGQNITDDTLPIATFPNGARRLPGRIDFANQTVAFNWHAELLAQRLPISSPCNHSAQK
jgi:hypothetical protein